MTKLKVIKFEKPSCAPCTAVTEMLNKAGIKHEKVNYITNIDLAVEMGVKSVPTVFAVIEKDGQRIVEHFVRGANPEEINDFIQKVSNHYSQIPVYD